MSYENDRACKILPDKEFLSFSEGTNEYHQANPKNALYAFVDFDFEYSLKESTELIISGETGNIVPYKGKAKEHIKLIFEKQGDDEYFDTYITVRVFDKESKTLCVYASEMGLRLPNLKGGNKFLFKMSHPDDETMSSFSLIHLP